MFIYIWVPHGTAISIFSWLPAEKPPLKEMAINGQSPSVSISLHGPGRSSGLGHRTQNLEKILLAPQLMTYGHG